MDQNERDRRRNRKIFKKYWADSTCAIMVLVVSFLLGVILTFGLGTVPLISEVERLHEKNEYDVNWLHSNYGRMLNEVCPEI